MLQLRCFSSFVVGYCDACPVSSSPDGPLEDFGRPVRGVEDRSGEKGPGFRNVQERRQREASGGDWWVGTRFVPFAACGAARVGGEFGEEDGDLLAPASDLDDRLAEVDLRMARRMMQWNEGLAHHLPARAHMVLHDRVTAREPVLVTQALENPVRRVPLLDRHVRRPVGSQDRIDDAGGPVQLGTTQGLPTPIARRRRID